MSSESSICLRVLRGREECQFDISPKSSMLNSIFNMKAASLTPHRDPALQIPLDDSSFMTIQGCSVGRHREINTSYAVPKPFTLSIHTEINGMWSGTPDAVAITDGVLLDLLTTALAALFFYVRRKLRGLADGSSKKNLKSMVETIIRNPTSDDDQAGEAMIEHTMTSAENGIHEVEEHTNDLHSHGQIVEADVGGIDDRAELV